MTRPASHRDVVPERSCGNCRFSFLPHYKNDLLCFHGDTIEVHRWDLGNGKLDLVDVRLDGDDVGLMEGEEYSHVWGGRAVDAYSGLCDEWQPEAST